MKQLVQVSGGIMETNRRNKHFPVLRTCASCEWIFKAVNHDPTCPKCQFGSYGARYVYGSRAYTYAKTQKPWKEKKLLQYEARLNREILTDDVAITREVLDDQ